MGVLLPIDDVAPSNVEAQQIWCESCQRWFVGQCSHVQQSEKEASLNAA